MTTALFFSTLPANRINRAQASAAPLASLGDSETRPQAPALEFQLGQTIGRSAPTLTQKNGNYRFCADPLRANTEIARDFCVLLFTTCEWHVWRIYSHKIP
jgi:hypothetical protein